MIAISKFRSRMMLKMMAMKKTSQSDSRKNGRDSGYSPKANRKEFYQDVM